MGPRILTLLLALLVFSVGRTEPAHAYFAEEAMLMRTQQACKVPSSQTSVASGHQVLGLHTVISKAPGEVLPASAIPAALVQVPYEISSPKMMAVYVRGVDFEQMDPEALNALLAMLEEANGDLARRYYDPVDPEGHKIYVHSGYRAYDVQCRLFNKKVRREMELYPDRIRDELAAVASVNNRSALPGQSEHQLGTAVDLVYKIPGMGYELEPEMDRTPGFTWLKANAFRYGYAMSYPKGNVDVRTPNPVTGYVYEPWHWRYIGIAYATAFEMCAKRGMTLRDYLRKIKANPYARCG